MKKLLVFSLVLVLCLTSLVTMGATAEEHSNKISVFLHVCKDEWSNDVLFKYLEDKFDIEFEWVPCTYSELEKTLNSLYASKDIPDFFFSIRGCQNNLYRNMAEEGLVWDLTPFIESGDYPNLQAYMATPSFEREQIDGKWYGIPRYYEPILPLGLWYRQDWLDELGLEVPTTVEEFRDVLAVIVAADPSGKGTAGYSTNAGNAGDVIKFTGTTGWRYYEDTGRYEQYYVREEYRDYLKYMNDLYVNGLMDPDYITGSDQWQCEKFASGTTFACYYNIDANVINPYIDTLLEVDPTADVRILAPLTGPAGNVANARDFAYDGCMGISAKASEQEVEAILAMCDFLVSDEGRFMALNGLEGIHYTKNEDGTITRIEAGFEADIANCSNIWALGVHRINQMVEGYFSRAVLPTVKRYELLSSAYQNNYDAIRATAANTTAFISQNQQDYGASVNDCYTQWMNDFITGVKDVNSDEQWETYISEVRAAGYALIEEDLNAWMEAQ